MMEASWVWKDKRLDMVPARDSESSVCFKQVVRVRIQTASGHSIAVKKISDVFFVLSQRIDHKYASSSSPRLPSSSSPECGKQEITPLRPYGPEGVLQLTVVCMSAHAGTKRIRVLSSPGTFLLDLLLCLPFNTAKDSSTSKRSCSCNVTCCLLERIIKHFVII